MAWKKLAFTDEVLTNPMTADLDMGGNEIHSGAATNYLWLVGGVSSTTSAIVDVRGENQGGYPGQIRFRTPNVAKSANLLAGYFEGVSDAPKFVIGYGLDMSAKDITDSADIFPDSTANDRQLGSSAKKWGDLYAVNIDSEYLNMSGDIDLNKNDLKAACIESLASAPSSPGTAQMYYNTADDHIHVNVV